MSFDLLLKPSCSGCGATTDLYGSNCKHMTLCSSCGRTMAENRASCHDCGATLTRLIREYNVRASSGNDKNYFIGRFVSGLPSFSKKKNAENRWSAHKEGLQGRQVTDAFREKYKNKPWLLEDETGQSQYHGHLEGSQSATYYLLMSQGKEFVAMPAGSWYNFNKVAQYKQLTLEEAEEKMKNRKKTADGYERWMMKAANNGAAAFGEVVKLDDKESGGGGRGRKKAGGDDDEGNASDRGEEDEEDESARKSKLGLNRRGGDDDDDEGPRGGDLDMDDDDEEKGDDWEHEENFTDDDEAPDVNPEEREDLALEAAPPEIKDDDEEEEEGNEEGGGLSQSGKELKKLLGKAAGLNESEGEDDDDDDDMDDEAGNGISLPLLPTNKQKDVPKEEPVEDTPTKSTAPTGSAAKGVSPASKTSKGKRKLNSDDANKPSSNAPSKKVKAEPEAKSSVKEEMQQHPSRGGSSSSSKSTPSSDSKAAAATGPVKEEEIKALLMQKKPITTQVLVGKFKERLRSREDKAAFAEILRKISKIQKTNGSSFVVLRDT